VTRIADAFARARAEDRAALIGYLTAFDPDQEGSLARLRGACEAGLDVIELGVPFSDPTADGTDVAAAMVRALGSGASLSGVLKIAARLRAAVSTPIVAFSYANPLLQRGAERFAREAVAAGIDGVLVVDLPPEHASLLRDATVAAGLDWIGLVAPTTTPARMDAVAAVTCGFVYAVTLRGVTGAALDVDAPALDRQLASVRERFTVPVAAGFGIRTPEQVRALAPKVDGVVVGSALVRAGMHGVDPLVQLVGSLRAATSRTPT
jgi:tryptophan synthase alpha chain